MSDPRIISIVNDLVSSGEQIFEKHQISIEEYHAAVRFLNEVAETGQIPLLLDVFLEARVVEANGRNRRGTAHSLLGPYYLEGAPFIEGGRLASESEAGDRLIVSGVVRNVEGKPLAGAVLEFWQADAQGRYSGFDPGPSKMNLRGRLRSGKDGSYVLHTVRPAAYTIPHEGPVGRVFQALGRHAWRPAHIHLKAGHEGCRSLITQIYLADSDYLDSDAANAVRNDLVRPVTLAGNGYSLDFDIVLEPDS
ncbi:MAG: dioxygenase [Desulfoferrobacter sp.]